MDISSKTHLKVTGSLRVPASSPPYTRLSGSTGVQSRFVEIRSSEVEDPTSEPLGDLVGQTIDVYVPNWATLFFSDYPAPLPTPPLNILAPGATAAPPIPTTGLFGSDGSPLSLIQGKDDGPITGLKGTDKVGNRYQLSIGTTSFEGKGRVSANATWLISKATFSVNEDPPVQTGIAYCPSNMLASLFFGHQDIQSLIDIDLSGPGLSMAVTRTVNYHSGSFSSQLLDVPASQTDPGMYLAVAPVNAFLGPLAFLSSGLKSIREGLPALPVISQAPLATLGSIYPDPTQPEASFVGPSAAKAASALAQLAASFATPNSPGAEDIAYWLGSLFAFGTGKPILETEFSSLYAAVVAYDKSHGGGVLSHKWPQVLASTNGGGLAQQAIDKILGG